MKIFIFLFCTSVFSFNVENVFSQEKIKINKDQLATVVDVFRIIKNQTDYDFIYQKKMFANSPKIQLEKGEILIADLLDKSLMNEEFDFKLSDGNIIIIKNESKLEKAKEEQGIEISGTVVDESGVPLGGANILEKGTTNGTQTDFDGNFTLKVAGQRFTLVVSYIGFLTKEIVVDNQTSISITLEEDASNLDEVVVVGYGTSKKSDLTGAISTVKAEQLPLAANTSVDQMLNGLAAGVIVNQNNAQPGGNVTIQIRGRASVRPSDAETNSANQPLYVIDGFPVGDGGVEPSVSGFFTNAGSRSPLNDINPNDIESIEILKDASSTAIYGARAANGVILITTKRGSKGKPTITYSANYTVQKITSWIDLLNGEEWATEVNKLNREFYLRENQIGVFGGQPDPGTYVPPYSDSEIASFGEGTDWLDLISRGGFVNQHNLSAKGGSDDVKYLVSLNYFDQQGVIKSSNLTRYSARMNFDQKISNRINWGVSATISQVDNQNVPLGGGQTENAPPIQAAFQFPPIAPPYDENGDLSMHPVTGSANPNPLSLFLIEDDTRTTRLFANSFVNVNIIEGLNARAKFGMDRKFGERNVYLPRTTVQGAARGGVGTKAFTSADDYLFGFTLDYSKEIGNHGFTVLAGYEYQTFNSSGFTGSSNGFVADTFLYNALGTATGSQTVSSYKSFNELASYFGRLTYNYDDRYLLTATMRADGSPTFGRDNKWGYFPSAALKWRISNEGFMANIDKISDLGLRIGYGETGNSKFGSQTAFALFSANAPYAFGGENAAAVAGVQQTRLENPNLKWETNKEINIGLDVGLFQNRISSSLEFFDKKVEDLLSFRNLRPYLPIRSVAANVGKTRSKGFEFTISTKNTVGEFKWNTSVTFGKYEDRWVERHEDDIIPIYLDENSPIRTIYGYAADGILQPGETPPVHQPDLQVGYMKFKDLNGQTVDAEGNVVLTEGPDGAIGAADLVFYGTPDPGYVYGITNTFKYKKFDLNIFLQGMGDRIKINSANQFFDGYYNSALINGTSGGVKASTNAWSSVNTDSTKPTGTGSVSSYIEDASYLRFKNITLGYTLPSFNNGISGCRLYIDVQNPYVITNYSGVDPETDGVGAYPNQLSVTLGLNVTF